MKIQELHIGQRVRDKRTRFEFIVTGLGVIDLDMTSPYVYCDFKGNEGDVFEFKPEELDESTTEI